MESNGEYENIKKYLIHSLSDNNNDTLSSLSSNLTKLILVAASNMKSNSNDARKIIDCSDLKNESEVSLDKIDFCEVNEGNFEKSDHSDFSVDVYMPEPSGVLIEEIDDDKNISDVAVSCINECRLTDQKLLTDLEDNAEDIQKFPSDAVISRAVDQIIDLKEENPPQNQMVVRSNVKKSKSEKSPTSCECAK